MTGFRQTMSVEPVLRYLRKRSRGGGQPATIEEIARALLAPRESVERCLYQLIASNKVDYKEIPTGRTKTKVYFACYAADFDPDE